MEQDQLYHLGHLENLCQPASMIQLQMIAIIKPQSTYWLEIAI